MTNMIDNNSNKPAQKNKDGEYGKWLPYLPLGVLIAAGSLGVIFSLAAFFHSHFKSEQFGQFGDFIGGILNPLISAFTLTVAVAVWKLQKQELFDTRAAIEKQTFDQFFMSMLASHRAMTEQVTLIDGETESTLQTGKRAIDSYRDLLSFFVSRLESLEDTPDTEKKDHELGKEGVIKLCHAALSGHKKVWKIPAPSAIPYFIYFVVRYYQTDLHINANHVLKHSSVLSFEQIFGHIYRSAYQILKIVDEYFVNDAVSKKRYVNLLRAQMSESEFVFFALSALTDDGKKSWARAVRLDFFEDRLQNIGWTQSLGESFKRTVENLTEAEKILRDE